LRFNNTKITTKQEPIFAVIKKETTIPQLFEDSVSGIAYLAL
jgi:hypothetical protein